MDKFEVGVWLAIANLAELHRQADQRRQASRLPGRTRGRRSDRAPGSPRPLGRPGQAAERTGGSRPAKALARAARRYALWALCSSAGSILLAAVALLTR
jgi:hypothetical protein